MFSPETCNGLLATAQACLRTQKFGSSETTSERVLTSSNQSEFVSNLRGCFEVLLTTDICTVPFCAKCKKNVNSLSALQDHYRGKAEAIHPKGSKCLKGFYNNNAAVEVFFFFLCILTKIYHSYQHYNTAHPKKRCSCGVQVYIENLEDHYINSCFHPTCTICDVGFKDDTALNEVVYIYAHASLRCTICKFQFRTNVELKLHFNLSMFHPNCPTCGHGCPDDSTLEKVIRVTILPVHDSK
ncbi:hypothetical protein R3P38DRAFT_2573487 [Favolaschia claudopus]|uniref:C2H2-type domain-containing protein n=1 Tax=Favolaschia claudopus TaxID=2862362 RepID=A0AAV9ZIG8_9AGAR